MMPSIMSGSLIRATPPCGADVGRHPLERHDRDGAGVLGDLGLLRRDDVHDDAALEHLGHAALDAGGAGADGVLVVRCHGMLPLGSTGSESPIVRPLGGRLPGRRCVGAVSAVAAGRRCRRSGAAGGRRAAAAAGAAGGRAAPGCRGRRRCRTAGPGRPGWRCRRGRPAARPARPAGRRAARAARGPGAFSASLPVPVGGRPGVGRGGGEARGPGRAPSGGRVLAGQLLGQAGAALQLGVQRRPGAGDAGSPGGRSRSSVHAVQASSRTTTHCAGRPASRPRASRGDRLAGAPPPAGSSAPRRAVGGTAGLVVVVRGRDPAAAGRHDRLVDREDAAGHHRPVVAGDHLRRPRADSAARRPGSSSRSRQRAGRAPRRRRRGPARPPCRRRAPGGTRRGRWPRPARRRPSPRSG